MKADAARLRRLFAAPPGDIRLFLFHGPDEAGIAAAATDLAAAFGSSRERIDLDGATLRKDPARLADAAASLSLFGDARLIRVAAAGEESLEALTLLLDADRSGHPVIALAPGVRATARIAKLAAESPRAVAAAFYEPGRDELERIATGHARDLGLTLDAGIARRLVDAAGADRAVMVREIEKIAVFLDADATRPHAVDYATLDAIGADLVEAALDAVVAALVDGNPAALGQALDRIGAGGASPIPWLRAVSRRLLALAAMRGEIDGGASVGETLKRHRVFFRDEAPTAAALRRWSPAILARAVDRLRVAERSVMATGNAGTVVADAAAIEIARAIAARR